MSTTLIVVIGLIVLAFIILIVIHNGLVSHKNQVEYAFGGMDAMLKKRYDLIPNLVSTVQQYAAHERELLENITSLRTQALDSNLSNDERVELDNQISGAMGKIMVAVESYPDLKANENFLHLQRSLNEVEEQISASRRAYNAAVTDYNNAIEMFPGSMLAGRMRLQRKKVFEIPETERQNVNVGELFNR